MNVPLFKEKKESLSALSSEEYLKIRKAQQKKQKNKRFQKCLSRARIKWTQSMLCDTGERK